MIYWTSVALILISFILLKKNKTEQNFWRSIVMALISYECYLCMIAGIMTIVHIPVDTYTTACVNGIIAFALLIRTWKKKEVQSYYIKVEDTVFIIALMIVITYIFLKRFSTNFNIVFETSDPGTHLKMAMNFANTKAVDGLYIGQLINGLTIESLQRWFSGVYIYKSFIIQYGINFFLSAAVFWAALEKYANSIGLKIVGYILTLVYVLGYPYNDMLYGFVYLQMTITVICYIVILMQDYMAQDINLKLGGYLLANACLTVSIGYTLFAPPVYISVLLLIMYKAYKEGWLKKQHKLWFDYRFILNGLYIFAIPTFLTIWYILIQPKLNGTNTDYIGNLVVEGAIYRNLYSDFLIYIPVALYAIINGLKKRELNLLMTLTPIYLIYYAFFLYRMLENQVSTYYFYKLNYLMWMILLLDFYVGVKYLIKYEKTILSCILIGDLLIAGIYISGKENDVQQENINKLPFAEANTFFQIYEFNKVLENRPDIVSNALIELSDIVEKEYKNQEVYFIGYWRDLYWFEALTNQRFPNLNLVGYNDLLQQFLDGQLGRYIIVQKDLPELENDKQTILNRIIYENDYGYILENK